MNKVIIFTFMFFLNGYTQTFEQRDNSTQKSQLIMNIKINYGTGNTFQLNYNRNSSHYFTNSQRQRPYVKENNIDLNFGFELLLENKLSDHFSLVYGLAYSRINLKPKFEYGYIPGIFFDERDNFLYNIVINNFRIPVLIKLSGKASRHFSLFLTGGLGINISNGISSSYELEVLNSYGNRTWHKEETDVIKSGNLPFFLSASTGLKYKSIFLELSYTHNISEIRESFGSRNKEMGNRAGFDTKNIFTILYNYFLINIGYTFSLK